MIDKAFEKEINKFSSSEKQRIEKVCEQLLCLNSIGVTLKLHQEWVPVWSIYELKQFISGVLSSPEGCLNDLILGFWKVLSVTKAPLTETMSDFIADLVYYSWLRQPCLYKQESFEWLVPLVNKGCTQAQAYLAANVVFCGLPVEIIKNCKDSILKILEHTDLIETLRYAFERPVIP